MTITTPKNSVFDTSKPVRSNLLMVLNASGESIMDDNCYLTGKYTVVEQFMEKTAMLEVSHSYGTDEVCEDFLWQ